MRFGRALLAPVLIVGLFACRSDERTLTRPVTYVAVGASDTVGVGAKDPAKDAWVAQLFRKFPKGSKFIRLGVSGSTAAQALEEQVPRAETSNADLVTVWLAVNDFNARVEADEYRSILTEVLERVGKQGAAVYVGNVPDLTLVPIYKSIPRVLITRRVREYNEAIAAAAKQTGAHLVDLYGPSQELSDRGESLIADDGFHPSEEGYELLADTFWAAIRKNGL